MTRLALARRPLARSRAVLLATALASAALTLALCGAAGAASVTPASLSMTSEAGDYVGQGHAWHYSTAGGDAFSVNNGRLPAVSVALTAANGDWWFLDFAAPNGQRLEPGVYLGATRHPFQAPASPGLAVYGQGRGCNTLTGSFEVHEASYAADGTPARFRASFEQHCEGMAPALLGSVEFGTPPPPALELTATIDPAGRLDRAAAAAVVTGRVTCSRAAEATIAGTISQQLKRRPVAGAPFATTVACSPAGTTWKVSVRSTSGEPFAVGAASVAISASAEGSSVPASAAVQLRR